MTLHKLYLRMYNSQKFLMFCSAKNVSYSFLHKKEYFYFDFSLFPNSRIIIVTVCERII